MESGVFAGDPMHERTATRLGRHASIITTTLAGIAAMLAGCTVGADEGAASSNDSLRRWDEDPPDGPGPVDPPPPEPLGSGGGFYVTGASKKCVDFGGAPFLPGDAVFLYGCNRTAAQHLYVREVGDGGVPQLRRAFEIRAGAGEICIGAKGGAAVAGAALELQACNGALSQRFAFDGDALMAAGDRRLVVAPHLGRAADRTPLVLKVREAAEDEVWTFRALDGSARRPTTGFAVAENLAQLERALAAAANDGWNRVITVAGDFTWPVTATVTLPAGITLRGDRQRSHRGPEIRFTKNFNDPVLLIRDDGVRITGLRFRGPSQSTDEWEVPPREPLGDDPGSPGIPWMAKGIRVQDAAEDATLPGFRALLDHNELYGWPTGAISVQDERRAHPVVAVCRLPATDMTRPNRVRITRNYIHDNARSERGYGVSVGAGGFPLVEGNTFNMNRHAITSAWTIASFRALGNLVLKDAPTYHWVWQSHDFDVHGSVKDDGTIGREYFSGAGGDYTEIAQNTFLGTDRTNFYLRGRPCKLAEFHHNVSLHDREDTINSVYGRDVIKGTFNWYNAPDPTASLVTGDVDGDGRQDRLMMTGQGWYVSYGGTADWQFLRAEGYRTGQIQLRDVDGDGRSDVVLNEAGRTRVWWGAVSPMDTLPPVAYPGGRFGL